MGKALIPKLLQINEEKTKFLNVQISKQAGLTLEKP